MTAPSPPSSSLSRPVRSAWSRGRTLRLLAGILLIAYSWVMAVAVPVPFIKVQPGSATDVLDLVSVDGAAQHPAEGNLLFLTVSISQRLSPLEAVVAWLDADADLQPESNYTGGLSREEITRVNLAVMRESKLVAVKVALEHLGFEVPVREGGAMITDVLPDRPAGRILEIGDLIVAVNGQPTTFAEQVIDAVRSVDPEQPVSLTIERDGVQQSHDVPTVTGDRGEAQIGIQLTNNFEFDFPFEVDINTGRVGGPSAGLAFTLAILDELTEGELTGGQPVAVTGSIDISGEVGQVGGVEQKAVAAQHAGAALMLTPQEEAGLARAHAGDMDVVGVDTLEDALRALDAIGGNALALPRDGGESQVVAAGLS